MSNIGQAGHGHVFPRDDGFRARCGGPVICALCAQDLARKQRLERPEVSAVPQRIPPVVDVAIFSLPLADRILLAESLVPEMEVVERWQLISTAPRTEGEWIFGWIPPCHQAPKGRTTRMCWLHGGWHHPYFVDPTHWRPMLHGPRPR